ncbi:MAG: apolipoprotein N-acyltransferase [Thermoanaerobaculia bacterium]|nr:apolipoprotein N-acyltransferase [Thermoanaerobaculia bacterium]
MTGSAETESLREDGASGGESKNRGFSRTSLQLLVAALGGWIWSLQFGVEALRFAPLLALTPLLVVLRLPRPGRLAWCYGIVFWVTTIPWIVPTIVEYGGIPLALAWPLMFGVGVYLGSYWAVFGWLGAKLLRRGPLVGLLGLPALWVLLEWSRGYLSDFPWNLAAYSILEVGGALPTAAWLGAFGVSGVVVLINVGAFYAILGPARRLGISAILVGALVLIAGGRWGAAEESLQPSGGGGEVRLLQPNIPNRLQVDAFTYKELRRLIDMSEASCDVPGALVLWPESAGWPLTWGHDPAFEQAVSATTSAGCSVLFNSTTFTTSGPFNSAYLVGPAGEAGRYDKRHLVPFGEYVPLRHLFSFIDTLARNAGDYQAADEVTLLPWSGEEIGLAICFEVTFPGDVAASVQDGATVLATLTNDAWYGDSTAPWQHLRAARFRAAENRRPLLRAAITGVSGLIDGRGRLVESLGVGEEGVLSARISGRRDLSFYTRNPHLVPWLSALVTLGCLLLSLRWGRRPES